jgi:hypothetical protein
MVPTVTDPIGNIRGMVDGVIHMEWDRAKSIMWPARPSHIARAAGRQVSWIGVAVFLLAGCTGSVPPGQPAASSPPPGQITQHYVALVHSYWIAYKQAEGDIPSLVRVCGYFVQVSEVDPPVCRLRIAAILPPHEMFLSALDTTPAPPKFAADDQAFRTQIPMAIAHLKATMAAAAAGNAQHVSDEFEAYVEAMIPLFPNLNHVDPSIPHD